MEPHLLNTKDRLVILKIVAIYACFSSLWIYFSDKILGTLFIDPETIVRISLFKGLLFIILTSFLLYQLIARYIRKSKQKDQALRESEKRLNKAQEIAHLGSWELDVAANILTWSDEVYRIFGLKPQEFKATYEAFLEVVHPEDRPAVDAAYTGSLREGKDDYEIEHRIIRKSTGEIRYLHEKCEHIRDHSGKIIRSVGMTHDITEQKLAAEAVLKLNEELEVRVSQRTNELEENRLKLERQNEELRETYNRLEEETSERIRAMGELREKEHMMIHQSRMAAMGEMLGHIAHQWRQPLNVLGLKIQELGLSYEYGSFSKELLEKNIAGTMEILKHLSQTIDDFRNFSALDKEKSLFRIDQVVEKTISLIKDNFLKQGINMEVSSSGEPEILGYPNEYSQVLLNILINAMDAFVERRIDNAQVTVRSWEEDGRAVVTITDNAGGIKDEIIDKIFDAYFTTKELGKGVGVGLFMCKNIIEKNMGGRLTVHNTENGAEFRIEI